MNRKGTSGNNGESLDLELVHLFVISLTVRSCKPMNVWRTHEMMFLKFPLAIVSFSIIKKRSFQVSQWVSWL